MEVLANMEVNLGHFKNVFVLESIYGTCTVSLTTLEQSKLKVAYSALLLTVYIGEQIIYFSHSGARSLLKTVVRMIGSALPFYTLTKAMFEYKARISAALNLEAIEERLKSNNISVPGNKFIKTMSVGLVVSNIVGHLIILITKGYDPEGNLPWTTYVTSFLYNGICLTEGMSLIMFLRKVVMIQSTITKAFTELRLEHEQPGPSRCQRPRNRGRRNIMLETGVDKKWALLTELQRSLNCTEDTIRESYKVQIGWYRLVVEILGPFLMVFLIEHSVPAFWGLYFIQLWLMFMSIIYAVERVFKEKETACKSLTKYRYEEEAVRQNRIKVQLLANIHRNQVPYSCGFFNADYALVATVVENFFFVLTSLLASLTKIN